MIIPPMLRFLLTCAAVILSWLVISKALAILFISSNADEETKMSVHAGMFLMPILLAYLLASWLQMKCKLYMYESLQLITLGKIPLKKPSQKIEDYIP